MSCLVGYVTITFAAAWLFTVLRKSEGEITSHYLIVESRRTFISMRFKKFPVERISAKSLPVGDNTFIR